MPAQIVILGGAGQLGVELTREFRLRGCTVKDLDRPEMDITDSERVERALAALDPQVVLNAAAYNQVDIAEEEPQAAFLVNALAVRNIALACRQLGALLVHFSTDYVFDGAAARPSREDDTPRPLNAYGVS
ncbi:MAG: sugar nucleotide-binding protein, partial [Acidobacteria bacterium]|nr:sugar nucleotide-binding protein [Acidobacteriota bacterium]